MKYLCLIYFEEGTCPVPNSPLWDELIAEHFAYDDEMQRSGHLVVTEPLEPAAAAATVRTRHGRLSVTDGPYIETKEELGGFYLLEARDLNDAIQLAARIPSARVGHVEIRPVEDVTELRRQAREPGVRG